MRRRFRVAVALTGTARRRDDPDRCWPGHPLHRLIAPGAMGGIELLLATPVVLWCGWPFFVRGVESIANRSPNMFTLIALGVAVSYLYSVVAVVAPRCLPAAFRDACGRIGTYFEAAAVIVDAGAARPGARARARAAGPARAIRALLGLAPTTARRVGSARRRGRRRSTRFTSATGCACGRARRCRSTASCVEGAARSTSRWSPVSRCPSSARRRVA